MSLTWCWTSPKTKAHGLPAIILRYNLDRIQLDKVLAMVVLPQAYLTLRTPVGNGIDWKIGVWDTIVGYESLNDPPNPNYTRSYAYQIEPTTHTGILGTYKVSDMVTVQAGVADSSNLGDTALGLTADPIRKPKRRIWVTFN